MNPERGGVKIRCAVRNSGRENTMLRVATLLALTVLLVAAAIHASTDQTHACSCVPPPSPQEALAKSEAVFAGKVVAVSGLPPGGYNSTDPRVVAFKVSAVWKGPSYETMFITTPLSGASCGFDFIEGKSYIVYAWNGVDVLLCSRTKLSDNARDDFATLGEGSSPEPGSSSPVPKSRPDLVPPSGCELPFGYVRGHIDLSAFGLIAPLAWLAWRRRSRR